LIAESVTVTNIGAERALPSVVSRQKSGPCSAGVTMPPVVAYENTLSAGLAQAVEAIGAFPLPWRVTWAFAKATK